MRRPSHAARPSTASRLGRRDGQSPLQPDPKAPVPVEETRLAFYSLESDEERTGLGGKRRSGRLRGRAGAQVTMNKVSLDEALLTLKDIQKHSKLSLRTLQRHVRNGKLQVLRFGRSVRVEPSAYANFLRKIRDGN